MEWLGQWETVCRVEPFIKKLEKETQNLPEGHEAREILKVAQQYVTKTNPLTNQTILQIKKSEYGHYFS